MKIIIALPANISAGNVQAMYSKVSAVASDHSDNFLNGREMPVEVVADVLEFDNKELARYIYTSLGNTDLEFRTTERITEIIDEFEKGAR